MWLHEEDIELQFTPEFASETHCIQRQWTDGVTCGRQDDWEKFKENVPILCIMNKYISIYLEKYHSVNLYACDLLHNNNDNKLYVYEIGHLTVINYAPLIISFSLHITAVFSVLRWVGSAFTL